MKYHLLLSRDDHLARWYIEFGSYTRSEVVFERQCLRDKGVSAKNLMLAATGDTQAEINYFVDQLNSLNQEP